MRDLLTARSPATDNLKIREGTHGGVYIEGVTETYVNSIEQVMQMMQQGQDNRAIGQTSAHHTCWQRRPWITHHRVLVSAPSLRAPCMSILADLSVHPLFLLSCVQRRPT